jgi:molecular chaperone DnaK (HSP70)
MWLVPSQSAQVDQDSEGNAVLVCPHVEPGCLYPEEVSTCVLAQLLADAARHTGRDVSKAVITVPAYFSDEQREATVAAGAPGASVLCWS